MSDDTTRGTDETVGATPEASRKMARRYFVKAVVYAAPAVASVVAVQHASAQSSFCNANCTTVAECSQGACIACVDTCP